MPGDDTEGRSIPRNKLAALLARIVFLDLSASWVGFARIAILVLVLSPT
jgi:hypothetical protein